VRQLRRQAPAQPQVGQGAAPPGLPRFRRRDVARHARGYRPAGMALPGSPDAGGVRGSVQAAGAPPRQSLTTAAEHENHGVRAVHYGQEALSMRLLLVEDDPRIAAPLVSALEESGHRVAMAGDGPTGLDLARAGEYDALILDVMLPGLDGFALARTLRSAGISSPILFLTARGELADRVEGLDLGGDAYLVKPFALAELKATL